MELGSNLLGILYYQGPQIYISFLSLHKLIFKKTLSCQLLSGSLLCKQKRHCFYEVLNTVLLMPRHALTQLTNKIIRYFLGALFLLFCGDDGHYES